MPASPSKDGTTLFRLELRILPVQDSEEEQSEEKEKVKQKSQVTLTKELNGQFLQNEDDSKEICFNQVKQCQNCAQLSAVVLLKTDKEFQAAKHSIKYKDEASPEDIKGDTSVNITKSNGYPDGRSLTDPVWLVIYIAAILGWLIMGILVGTTQKLKGSWSVYHLYKEECTEEKPYLIIFDIISCFENNKVSSLTDHFIFSKYCISNKVCVDKCPRLNVWDAEPYLTHQLPFNRSHIIDYLICINEEVKNDITTLEGLQDAIDNNLCMKKTFIYFSILNLCLPYNIVEYPFSKITVFETMELLYYHSLDHCLELVILLTVCTLLVLFYANLLHWIAGPIAWLSTVQYFVVALVGTVIVIICYNGLVDQPVISNFYKLIHLLHTNFMTYVPAIFVMAIVAFKLLYILKLKRHLKAGLTLIKESSKVIENTTGSLLLTFFSVYIYGSLIIWAWSLVIIVFGNTGEEYTVFQNSSVPCNCSGIYENVKQGDMCLPRNFTEFCQNCYCNLNCSMDFNLSLFLQTLNILMFNWSTSFIYIFNKLVLTYAFSKWYYEIDEKKASVPNIITSISNTLKYHLGTTASGSFFLFLRLLAKTMDLFSHVPLVKNIISKFAAKCGYSDTTKGSTCFQIVNRAMQTSNARAYTYSFTACILYGTNLKYSIEKSNVIIGNYEIEKPTKVVRCILDIIKWTIECGLLVFIIIENFHKIYSGASLNFIIVLLGTYFISSLFISVYTTALDTLILCYLQESECEENAKGKFNSTNFKKMLKEKDSPKKAE